MVFPSSSVPWGGTTSPSRLACDTHSENASLTQRSAEASHCVSSHAVTVSVATLTMSLL